MRTFLLVCFMRIFSRANTMSEAIGMYQKLFTDFHITEAFKLKTYQIGLTSFDCFLLVVFIFLMLIISLYQRQHQVREMISKQNTIIRWMIYLSATFSLILFEVTSGGGFLYAVF